MDKKYNEIKNSLDKADLVQTIIIIASLAVAAIVGIGSVSAVIMEKGETTANCIANNNAFETGNIKNCQPDNEDGNNENEDNGENEVLFREAASWIEGGGHNGVIEEYRLSIYPELTYKDAGTTKEEYDKFHNAYKNGELSNLERDEYVVSVMLAQQEFVDKNKDITFQDNEQSILEDCSLMSGSNGVLTNGSVCQTPGGMKESPKNYPVGVNDPIEKLMVDFGFY